MKHSLFLIKSIFTSGVKPKVMPRLCEWVGPGRCPGPLSPLQSGALCQSAPAALRRLPPLYFMPNCKRLLKPLSFMISLTDELTQKPVIAYARLD